MIMKTTITSFSEGNSEKTVNTVVALSIYLIVWWYCVWIVDMHLVLYKLIKSMTPDWQFT